MLTFGTLTVDGDLGFSRVEQNEAVWTENYVKEPTIALKRKV